MKKPGTPPDPALLRRAVTWARLPGHGHTIAEACARFGITPGQYRRARREFSDCTLSYDDDDLILSALHPAGPVRVEAVVYYYAWINRAELTRAKAIAILRRLIARGLVERVAPGIYQLTAEWP